MDPKNLEQALAAIGKIIHTPHFKTRLGMRFNFASIHEALAFESSNGEKPVLDPFLP